MRRKISLFLLSVVLLVGAVGNYNTTSNPQRKMTTYFRTHAYGDQIPDYETDVPATLMDLAGINLAIVFASAVVLIAGGFVFQRKEVKADSTDPLETHFSLIFIVDSIVDTIRDGREKAVDQTIEHLNRNGLLDRAEKSLRDQGIKVADTTKQWACSQDTTRAALIKSIQDNMGLDPEISEKLGNAIASRFNERLQAAKKMEVAKMLRQSGNNRLVNAAPDLAQKIFNAVNLGMPENEAVRNVIADVYKLPIKSKK